MGKPIAVCKACGQVVRGPEMTVSDVVEERIAIVEDWVAENPESDFDLDFLINIKEWLHEHGYLTPKQMSALNNIIEKFEME